VQYDQFVTSVEERWPRALRRGANLAGFIEEHGVR
jgi:hypothetical protein